jgi:phospholipase C
MGNRSFRRRLLNGATMSASILSLVGYNVAYADPNNQSFGANANDRHTSSPIKHVVVIIGENRTFDHIFATYLPPHGEHVDNLLSRGVITAEGRAGRNYAKAIQYSANDVGSYSIAPTKSAPYDQNSNQVQAPGTSYAFKAPYGVADGGWQKAAWDGPGALATVALAAQAEYGLAPADLPLLTTGTTGVAPGSADQRLVNYFTAGFPGGPYPLLCGPGAPLVNGAPVCAPNQSLYSAYGGSPVHRFYQMWQQLDCSAISATAKNPSGCLADLFPWVEITHSGKEGDISMGFYNVQNGDAPYFTQLAQQYTLADNYHQGVMGGTWANFMMLGYADALWYDPSSAPQYLPTTPWAAVVENPNPQPNTNNVYTNDSYTGGSYSNCSDPTQPGVRPIREYLDSISVRPNCEAGKFYLLNNFAPAYTGNGVYDPKALTTFVATLDPTKTVQNILPIVLPPVRSQRHIGDELTKHSVSYAYFGERWKDFAAAPTGAFADYPNPAVAGAYAYCNICNPFLYSASTMEHEQLREQHNKDLSDFYDAIENGSLPAVSYVKPSTFTDGHPASSTFPQFEAFTKRIVAKLQANPNLWAETAVLITVDEGGGYYDGGYVQPVDYFGDGTRIPLIVVSKWSTGGHVAHEYADHASVIKFIERNWQLDKLSKRSRDNLPNPITYDDNPYVPVNRPAIGDLWSMFKF